MTRVALRAKDTAPVPARAEVLSWFRALPERTRTWWAWGGCVLLALLLRVPYLETPLGRDEGGLLYMAQNWPGGHGSLYGDYWVDRPPLLLLLFKAASVGGDTGVRVLGAVFAVGLVLLIAAVAQAVAGPRAGRIAALLAALLSGSVSIGANFTPGELLAVVPSTASVLCLVLAHRSRDTRMVIAAGALSVIAALVKQSFLDAGVAGAAFLIASAVVDREVRWRWPLAYAAGAVLPLIGTLIWLGAGGHSVSGFVYTLFGFRIELLHTLAGSDIPLHVRLQKLEEPTIESGLLVALVAGVSGLVQLRRDRVLVVTFAAWLGAAVVGVLGGGSYFAHYLIELIPVTCVAASVLIARTRWPVGLALVGVFLWLALPTARDAAIEVSHQQYRQSEVAVAKYLRDNAKPGETDYVMYARPNVVYYAGLRHPYPYLWSLMVRAKPGAREELVRHLSSSKRPTWVVGWHEVDGWELDEDGRMSAALGRGYRLAATVCGHGIYVRTDRRPQPKLALGSCPYDR